ncbi:copper resistance CopC family protein [Curtobacterium flaccumfaciens]|uniref:copper resistance CopC family protein n=1 Tax=Curtobacterium flaccumfaciens TaxID=2035 RepID=UPI001BDE7957|nr:copper resistance CopC family protein [Curtobacterium flaccumfaciens]MBT1605978.1 copper resistance protein CopC [Curtobacterium flaccumfaciens pv. betae]MBT1656519.1 copper resistance protein CopC [Curtobacterium flaccumfaciens pv. betae]MCS0470694.1 copper resistance protein CopC [Curtobacterium flaccumfaciens pv. betae]MCS0473624.1 copper resistance protein CopC [Curtobacterium flaccumfaciens pv. betae]MCS0477106.1 copper resistance protein CopC [Curtobacterium flaccumfaciens pv. betae]
MRTARNTAAALAIVAAGLLTLVGVQPASAHSALTSSTPADGAVVTEPLESVDLTFSEAPLAGLDAGLRIQVTDASGADVATGDVRVSGTTMRRAVDLDQGSYTVLWRYVSPDGHPIEGTLAFEYRAAAPASTPSASATPTPSPAPTPSATATATGASDGAPSSSPGIAPGVWIGLGAGAVLVAGAVVVLLLRRGRSA